jgi:hypothetical protein
MTDEERDWAAFRARLSIRFQKNPPALTPLRRTLWPVARQAKEPEQKFLPPGVTVCERCGFVPALCTC